MADEVSIEQLTQEEEVKQVIEQLVAMMPDEIVLVDNQGNPYDEDEDEPIILDPSTKHNLALLMLATGEDFETVVNNTLKYAVEGLDSDEEE